MLSEAQQAFLRQTFGDRFSQKDSEREFYGRDWTRFHTPNPAGVVFPQTVQEIQQLVLWANTQQLALVPSGGRTGLSGGAVAIAGELVVSLEKMNRLLAFDALARTVTVEAGYATEALQQFAAQQGLFYPVDFASRGSAQIGGNIATNAGGIKVIRYGLTRDQVLGLKVVTGRGDILDLNQGLIKNATGYDLRHLFVGSEGTLGFIVEATLKLVLPPLNPTVMVMALPDLASVMAVYQLVQASLTLNAFEFFSDNALRYVELSGRGVSPFEARAPYYVLLEFDAPNEALLESAYAFFEAARQRGMCLDAVLSGSAAQASALWSLRESISECIAPFTPYKNDISLPLGKIADFMAHLNGEINQHYPEYEIVWFGHVGDGNLHLNILKPQSCDLQQFKKACETVNTWVYGLVQTYGGSISAEHGIGLIKKPYLHYTRSPAEIALLKQIRLLFDPNRILNPGKLLDDL